jgi:hypothetical protein
MGYNEILALITREAVVIIERPPFPLPLESSGHREIERRCRDRHHRYNAVVTSTLPTRDVLANFVAAIQSGTASVSLVAVLEDRRAKSGLFLRLHLHWTMVCSLKAISH